MNHIERRAILVQRLSNKKEKIYLEELKELAKSAGYIPVLSVTQMKPLDTRYQIGSGKVKELKRMIKKYDIDTVIFFNELSASQYLNLVKILRIEVIDRFQLLLEIFSRRAGSKEAKLQIELARLKRELSYVKEKIHILKRNEAPGFLSGGRYGYETYAKHIRKRISIIEKKLEQIRRKKDFLHRRRIENGLTIVTLTGYTGAGKTTLFNLLTNSHGYIDGLPFATISTTLRRKSIKGKKIILTDSIGFMESIPPSLIESFYATLEEIAISDLLLLVIDISDPLSEIMRKANASIQILHKIGVPIEKVLAVFNKIDLVNRQKIDRVRRSNLGKIFKHNVFISAYKKIGIEDLEETINEMLPGYIRINLSLPISFPPDILSNIFSNTAVREIHFDTDYIFINLELKRTYFQRIKSIITSYGGKINEVQNSCLEIRT